MPSLLILDIDGVMTDGTKVYSREHSVLTKRFFCKDFTAIKRFIAAEVKVVMVSGDEWNRTMAEKRNIDFYCSRGSNLSLDKTSLLPMLAKTYQTSIDEMMFVGDDYFDLSMFKALEMTFCPNDAPVIIKENAYHVLRRNGGEGVVAELYDKLLSWEWIKDASPDAVALLDKQEAASQEMQ
jgi:3-deoxy-D-manno-octulosonate 8-phosphate phosphatase (KDO 8-P phosphatase)